MSDQIPSGNRDFELLKLNSSVARFRRRAERLQKELEEQQQRYAQAEELLGKFSAAYKAMKEDPRMQMPIEQFDELRGMAAQRTWQTHEGQFESALNGLTANGVTARQILRAVGYDPSMVEELTPEIMQDVIQTAYAEFPQLFSVATEPQGDQAEPQQDTSLPGQLAQDFAALSQRPNNGTVPQAQTPTAQAVPNGMVQPQQPPANPIMQRAMQQIPGMQQVPSPQLQFKGYGDLQGRGGPAPTKSPVVAARLRDPAWLAQNQGALARAVAEGANVIDAPE